MSREKKNCVFFFFQIYRTSVRVASSSGGGDVNDRISHVIFGSILTYDGDCAIEKDYLEKISSNLIGWCRRRTVTYQTIQSYIRRFVKNKGLCNCFRCPRYHTKSWGKERDLREAREGIGGGGVVSTSVEITPNVSFMDTDVNSGQFWESLVYTTRATSVYTVDEQYI